MRVRSWNHTRAVFRPRRPVPGFSLCTRGPVFGAVPHHLGPGSRVRSVHAERRPALALTSIRRPVIGQTGTTQIENIPVGASAGVHLYSFAALPAPGLDLTAIGLPGCFLCQGGDVAVPFSTAASSATHSLGIPANNDLIGGHLFSQSVVVAAGTNTLGVITSNGMDGQFDVQ